MVVNNANNISYRLATVHNTFEIFNVLEEVAPEIPLLLDSKERREAILNQIGDCCAGNGSWVAATDNNQIVGFLLAKPHKMERFLHENLALEIPYIGISKDYRGRGVFTELVRKVMAERVPLTAVVKHANQSCMPTRLTKLGFTRVSASLADEGKFLWRASF